MKTNLLKLNKKIIGTNNFSIRSSFDYSFFENVKGNIRSSSFVKRSFAQYKCQNKKRSFLNIILFFSLPIVIFIPIVLMLIYSNKKSYLIKKDFIAVLPNKNILPHSFITEDVTYLNKSYQKNFNFQDVRFCYNFIFRYLLFPYFWLKCVYIILIYSGIVKTDSKEILVSNEYSFTSSILTEYINLYGKKCSNCMHGEKTLCLRDCFSTYDSFYIWDPYYIELLKKMDVQADFIISSCDALKLDLNTSEKEGDIVFFLQGFETLDDLQVIRCKLDQLSKIYGGDIYVKSHPRYKSLELDSVFEEHEVLNGSFENSVKISKVLVSNYSTVLFQVYINKKILNTNYPIIVVNDLIDLPPMYIMKEKADILFSNL